MPTKPRNHESRDVRIHETVLAGIRKRAQNGLANRREAMTLAMLATRCDAMADTLLDAPEFTSRDERRRHAAPTARLMTLSNVAWCLDVSEDACTDPTLVGAHVLRFIAQVFRDELRGVADREDVPSVWEDEAAIQARLLRDELGLGPSQIGRVLVGGTLKRSQADGLEPRAQARRKETERRAKQMRRILGPLLRHLLTGIRTAGLTRKPPEPVLKELARRTSIAALVDQACFEEIERIRPKVGRPRSPKRPPRTN